MTARRFGFFSPLHGEEYERFLSRLSELHIVQIVDSAKVSSFESVGNEINPEELLENYRRGEEKNAARLKTASAVRAKLERRISDGFTRPRKVLTRKRSLPLPSSATQSSQRLPQIPASNIVVQGETDIGQGRPNIQKQPARHGTNRKVLHRSLSSGDVKARNRTRSLPGFSSVSRLVDAGDLEDLKRRRSTPSQLCTTRRRLGSSSNSSPKWCYKLHNRKLSLSDDDFGDVGVDSSGSSGSSGFSSQLSVLEFDENT